MWVNSLALTCILETIFRLHHAQIAIGLGGALVVRSANGSVLLRVALHDALGAGIGQAEALDQREGKQRDYK